MGVELDIMVGRVRMGATASLIGDVKYEFPVSKMFSDIYEDFFKFDESCNRVDFLNLPHSENLIDGTGYGKGFTYCGLSQFIDFIENHARELKTPPKEIMGVDHEWHAGKREDAVWEYPTFRAIMNFLRTLLENGSKDAVFLYWS